MNEDNPNANINGVPDYYRQKPEVHGVANGGGAVKKVKKDASQAAGVN